MPGDSTVAEILRHQARTRETHPLLVCDAERISYTDADVRSAELARGLIALGAGKGTHVGLLYPNGTEFVVAMLAAARIGAVVIPFSTFATAGEMREQLVDSDVEILLATPTFRSHDYAQRLSEVLSGADLDSRLWCTAAPQLRHVAITHESVYQRAGTVDPELLQASEDDVHGCDPLAIVYTSGSTSAPKGVVHTHAALLGHQYNLNHIRGLTKADKLFCNSPFFWVGGFAFGLLATLVAGSTLVCSNATDAGAMLDLLEAENPTMTNGFAAGIAHLVDHSSYAERDLSSMRRGNLYPIMAPDTRPADPELRHNMLGMTEAGSVVLIGEDESDQPEARRGSFGKPAPGFQMMLVHPDTTENVAAGEVGELCIRGPYVMQGYYKRSREECFDADGWFHSGDLVRTDADGFVYFVGRLRAMIKTAGANVSAAEVEQAITKVTGGAPAYVIGLPDPRRGQLVAAVVVRPDGAAPFDDAALSERLKTELSAYKIPKRFITVHRADVPLLSSGKVDTRQLRKLFDA
ncbi:class I adenylate-forming enzyme family protein [Mycobacterium montefiorense]|uniref:AMP-binding protein n=1 Tax=Mycobacterium montefiorense TaxID=154654 RepID=A0AA37UXG5_9MYCO|nr:class I adenylate-forming enzyme family protein [Mycobacterium montefiorense]GBG39729.1 AMP-binding protein [Mycobacterium montefiorense]GKU35600.1 AMP-binding protein [Mycobacterium montefiorense]GKU40605.1 AMP-binding protein [Mycobacterium montefiorense]GKU45108.1 AMP-binding protein [Mycobacterium montefiorense]GKU51258.1 AMP-binding protein [Mycobacterium montefiorense]